MKAKIGTSENRGPTWQEEHILRALLSQPGNDAIGNLIVGDAGRQHFIQRPEPVALPAAGLAAAYAERARQALSGETPTSSAGGEQPKFGAYAETASGSRHVLVKFSLDVVEGADNPVAQRWRDLLLAEHHALTLLRENAIAAVATHIIDHGRQRFLEVERFDRIGTHGRRGLISLSAMDAEFIGLGRGGWPAMTARLLAEHHITGEAHEAAGLLHAFGTLIGNTDMHSGNLSFVTDSGRPYQLAPAYDMLPMAFAPRSSGELPATLPAAGFDSQISTAQVAPGTGAGSDLSGALEWRSRLHKRIWRMSIRIGKASANGCGADCPAGVGLRDQPEKT